MITIYRLKSDNLDCFVSAEAYREITLQMSTGDFGAHRKRELTVTPDQLERIKYHSGKHFVDFTTLGLGDDEELLWWFYDGQGDCTFECA